MTDSDPNRSFKFTNTNVRFRIAKQTLPTTRSLCAAVVSRIVRFLRHKRTWEGSRHLVPGRDAHYWAPTGQIRTGGIPAYGSYLEYLAANLTPDQG